MIIEPIVLFGIIKLAYRMVVVIPKMKNLIVNHRIQLYKDNFLVIEAKFVFRIIKFAI